MELAADLDDPPYMETTLIVPFHTNIQGEIRKGDICTPSTQTGFILQDEVEPYFLYVWLIRPFIDFEISGVRKVRPLFPFPAHIIMEVIA